jgi:(2Fe-2S) ferredoxin
MSQTKQKRKMVEFVVCGRFEERDDGSLRPGPVTFELIKALEDRIRRRELNTRAQVSVCNCGQAEQDGSSISILPERVRYFDVDPGDVDQLLSRHVSAGPGENG